MKRIRRLVGDVTAEQLRYVDVALARDVGVFVPVAGPCGYAILRGHVHPAPSFVVPFDERSRVRIDGRVVATRPGEVCVIGAGVPHEELPEDPPARYAAVFVAPRLLRAAAAAYAPARLPPLRGLRFEGAPEIVAGVREMMVEAAGRLPGHAALLDATGLRLVHHLLRALLGVDRGTARLPERAAIRRAVEVAEARLADPLSVADLARAAGLSPFHFSREFKREVGASPRAWLARTRLERAKRLLAADDRGVTDVALECGFCSASHLATAFTRAFRLAPSRYRAMLRRGRVPAQAR